MDTDSRAVNTDTGHTSAKYVQMFINIDMVIAVVFTIAVSIPSCFTLVRSYKTKFSEKLAMKYPNASPDQINDTIFTARAWSWIVLAILVVAFLFDLYLFILGRRGLRKSCYSDCRKWFRYRTALFIGSCFYFIQLLRKTENEFLLQFSIFFISVVYRILELYMSKSFINH